MINKSVFSCLRQLTTWHCPHSAAATTRLLVIAGRAAINLYLLRAGPTAANPQQRRLDGTDGRTDARQLHRPCSTHTYVIGANNVLSSSVAQFTRRKLERKFWTQLTELILNFPSVY